MEEIIYILSTKRSSMTTAMFVQSLMMMVHEIKYTLSTKRNHNSHCCVYAVADDDEGDGVGDQ